MSPQGGGSGGAKPRHRLVVLAGGVSWVPGILLEATLRLVAKRDDMEVAAVVVGKPQNRFGARWRCFSGNALLGLRARLDPALARRHRLPTPVALLPWARRLGLELLVPPATGVNSPDLVARLRGLRPTVALSFYWLEKLGPELLGLFRHAVNYHNGALPAYRGRNATAWSVYHGEERSGFAFHHMSARLDEGPVLLAGSVAAGPGANAFDLELSKAGAAAACLPRVLDRLAQGHPGEPQEGAGRTFSRRQYLDITRIDDPSSLTSAELSARLDAFECLHLKLGGRRQPVTKLRQVRQPAGSTSFRTADGVLLTAARLRHLPPALFRLVSWAAPAPREGSR